MEIVSLNTLNEDQKLWVLEKIEEIFFMSSSLKSFSSDERKKAFYKRWCVDFQTQYPEEFFVVTKDNKVLGYLSGCSDSTLALSTLEVPGFSVFQDLFVTFPAHLHINFHPDARGLGLGSILMNYYMDYLKRSHIKGVHLITSPDAQNVSFYSRLGFTKTETRDFNGMPLFFMGRELIPE